MSDPKKPSGPEDEYFAREDLEKKRKLAHKQGQELEAKLREELKKLHHMKCPKCGMDLHTVNFRGVEIDKCFSCGATVFDAGELEKIGVTESDDKGGTTVQALLRWFK